MCACAHDARTHSFQSSVESDNVKHCFFIEVYMYDVVIVFHNVTYLRGDVAHSCIPISCSYT